MAFFKSSWPQACDCQPAIIKISGRGVNKLACFLIPWDDFHIYINSVTSTYTLIPWDDFHILLTLLRTSFGVGISWWVGHLLFFFSFYVSIYDSFLKEGEYESSVLRRNLVGFLTIWQKVYPLLIVSWTAVFLILATPDHFLLGAMVGNLGKEFGLDWIEYCEH